MRIGITFHTRDSQMSGVEYYTLGLIRSLLRIDCENTYVVFTNRPDLVEMYAGRDARLTMHKFGWPASRLWRIAWEHLVFPCLLQTTDLDIVHFPQYICPCFGRRVPYVATVHDTLALDRPDWCKVSNVLYHGLFMPLTMRKAAAIIAVSKSTAADIKRHWPASASRIVTIYPGIDDVFREPDLNGQAAIVRKRYYLPSTYYLFVGNMEPKKNIRALLSVVEQVEKKGLKHKLVIVSGRSWKTTRESRELERWAKTGNVILTGYVPRQDLPYIYRMARLLMFPSLYEGFGFPPLEAMASGTPVLSSKNGALAETLTDAAVLIDPNDVSQIVQSMATLIDNAKARTEYVRLGLERSRHFDWDTTARQTLALYEQIVARKRKHPL
jgi:glycosyltransferase involved in cell wall biosynthesis